MTIERFRFAWAALVVVGFALEIIAYRNSMLNDTLSERVAWLQSQGGVGMIFRWVLCGFLSWLTIHFASARLEGDRVRFVWTEYELFICVLLGAAVGVACLKYR